MNVRKLLQTELWSKRTTRKMLVGIGIALVLLVVGYGVWYEVEVHWLTQGERNAAKDALREIDALQDANSLNDEEFRIRLEQTSTKVQRAEDVALTYRDNFLQMKLSAYLTGIEMDRYKLQRRELAKHGLDQREPDIENDEKIESILSELKKNNRLALHQELDK